MSLPKVLIVNPVVPQSVLNLFKDKCYVSISPAQTKEALLPLVKGPQLKMVATSFSGCNHLDLKELKRRGIKCSKCGVHYNSVADTAVLLVFEAAKRLTEGRWYIERGTWPRVFDVQWMLGRDISGATIGLIGFDGIWQTIAARTRAFHAARILYAGNKEKTTKKKEKTHQLGHTLGLIRESDFIFLSSISKPGLCATQSFEGMKNTVAQVNVGSGDLVDREACLLNPPSKDRYWSPAWTC